MTHLYRTKAADFFRDRRTPDRDSMIVGGETAKHLVQHRLVVGDQRTLGFALLRIAEDVEHGAAQTLQPGQQPENTEHPWPEGDLARPAGLVGRAEERRAQIG